MERWTERRLDVRLTVALGITVLFHGSLLASGSYRSTYDAYVHLFFADHYARSWFSSWEPRWYTGFTTVSYPPGGHQLLALWSKVLAGDTAFVPVMLFGVVLLVVGVYRFSRLWVSDRAAGYAAVLAAVSSSIAETVHVFGQLPTVLSLGMLLNALPYGYRWVSHGGAGALLAAVACSAGTTAAHHVTTLFGSVFFLGPVLALALLERFRTPLPDEHTGRPAVVRRRTLWPLVARRLRRVLPAVLRTVLYGVLVVAGLVVVVLPYWLWSASDPITQIPIPHASRDSFVENPNAGLVFWLIPWGVMLVALPYALVRGAVGRTWPLAASLGLLTLLGTGGTTPVPRAMLGGAFEILTLDRFTFWATIVVLPFAGALAESLLHGRVRHVIGEQFGRRAPASFAAVLAVSLVGTAIFAATLTTYRPFQPDPIDMDPIVAFVEKDQHDRWRYLTLGFGDQMAWLSARTEAETVDGNYHSARRLPELTSTPVERLEGAKYSGVPGLGSLQQFLAIPDKYHLKYVFSNDRFYDPLLWASGWQRLEPLENGVALWQRDDVEPLPAGRLRPELPLWQRLAWGVLPLTAMATAWAVMLTSALGVEIGRRRRSSTSERPWSARGPYRRIDDRLRRAAARLDGADERVPWQLLDRVRRRVVRRVMRPVAPRRRRLQASLLLAAVAGALGAGIVVRTTGERDATEVVAAYYDALDLRRLDEAYELLDPQRRPSWTQYLTERSVINGLVASYARLDSIESEIVERRSDGSVEVRSRLVYVTALAEHQVEQYDVVRSTDVGWRLEPAETDQRIPPDQLVTRADVDYLSQGRRQVTDGPTAYQDVIDRPEIRLLSARLVRHEGRLAVVGELRNDDVDPGYVTVAAELVDDGGGVLTEYTAATGAVHTALPGEIVPFRIDFEGVAGLVDAATGPEAEALGFEPDARTPLEVDVDRIASVRVSARAVVTGLDLDRDVTAQDLQVHDGILSGELRNDGVVEATVPHVFVTLRDADHEVAWVADAYPSEAIRPQRSIPFRLELPDPEDIERLDRRVELYANSLVVDRAIDETDLFDRASGWDGLDVMVVSFTRSAG